MADTNVPATNEPTDVTNLIEYRKLRDRKSGRPIYPVTDFRLIENVPNVMTDKNIKVMKTSQTPAIGPNVQNAWNYNQYDIRILGFHQLVFSGSFQISKKMFTAAWGSQDGTLMFFPSDMNPNGQDVQDITARLVGDAHSWGLHFRNYGNRLIADGITAPGLSIDNLPDIMIIEITSTITEF
ncbi:hypothetical protein M3M38_00035 [Fructilactobacillus cliffordii]|uniref:hypothetical protein n=1 Tax=Fructilactobacillus cliffordii TaxID=2940299 RepID=UPI002093653A|nr:hypothetical protein [Fructilactobacillus cliffordii]USS86505.1 hypothetical protein M3M38_00035 [Fructilactobacillus cliffordii]